ncbi:MAG: hypothetical protein AVO33_10225 [delta proteobacterium ML8_F1]|nr:MAG: hypothetical protein AVO33_10225 [delta proteobacterium ML8_F1]
MEKIVIESPGFLMALKDSGRHAWGIFGVPVSGPADFESAMLGNLLVGNPPEAAVIEMTLGGGKIRFCGDFVIALTGAPTACTIDGRRVPMGETLQIRGGEVLEIATLKKGMKTYLSIGGSLGQSEILGSHSVSLTGGIGRPFACGDILTMEANPRVAIRRLPDALRDPTKDTGPIRVIRGPEIFPEEACQELFSQSFTVSHQSNDMGLRLEGKAIPHRHREMISSGVAYGTIQVPPGGQPLIMMADHPVTGGYPRIAGVITRDLSRLAQLRPGETLSFVETTLEKAHRELAAFKDAIREMSKSDVRVFRIRVRGRVFEVEVEAL